MKSKKLFPYRRESDSCLKESGCYRNPSTIWYVLLQSGWSDIPNTELCEDVLQKVILKIWTSGNSYDPRRGRLFTWMINLTRNYTLDVLRTKRYKNSKKTVNIDDCHPAIDKQKNIHYNTESILIKDLVHELKPEFNVLLDMVYFKGYTHLETAEELNLPLGTVKTRIRMAIIELRTQFD